MFGGGRVWKPFILGLGNRWDDKLLIVLQVVFFFFPHSSCDSETRAKDMFENREICYVMITD